MILGYPHFFVKPHVTLSNERGMATEILTIERGQDGNVPNWRHPCTPVAWYYDSSLNSIDIQRLKLVTK